MQCCVHSCTSHTKPARRALCRFSFVTRDVFVVFVLLSEIMQLNYPRTEHTLGHQKHLKKTNSATTTTTTKTLFDHPENACFSNWFIAKHWTMNMAIDLNKNMKKKKIIADNFTIWFYCLCASFFCLTAFYFCHPTCSEASKVSGFILCGFEWNERIAETLIYCIWHFFGSMRNIFLYQIDFLRIPKKNQFIPIRNVLHWPSPHVFHVIRFTVNFTKRCPRTTYVGHFIVDFIG